MTLSLLTMINFRIKSYLILVLTLGGLLEHLILRWLRFSHVNKKKRFYNKAEVKDLLANIEMFPPTGLRDHVRPNEICKLVKKLKLHKAPGIDGI